MKDNETYQEHKSREPWRFQMKRFWFMWEYFELWIFRNGNHRFISFQTPLTFRITQNVPHFSSRPIQQTTFRRSCSAQSGANPPQMCQFISFKVWKMNSLHTLCRVVLGLRSSRFSCRSHHWKMVPHRASFEQLLIDRFRSHWTSSRRCGTRRHTGPTPKVFITVITRFMLVRCSRFCCSFSVTELVQGFAFLWWFETRLSC